MYKIDLHTHSILSPDGGITEGEYEKILNSGRLDFIAITDHNEVDFAMKARQKLGERVIVGEEIMTQAGEVVGLYLTRRVPPGTTLRDAIQNIIDQGGIVYIPHPFLVFPGSLSSDHVEKTLTATNQVIIEVHNARTCYFTRSLGVQAFARKHDLAQGASSDSHCQRGISAYTDISAEPTPDNLVTLMKSGQLHPYRAPVYSLICPRINILRKILSRSS